LRYGSSGARAPQAENLSTSNIFLVGPMGVGKSTIGKRLAAVTGKRFVDSDEEIERKTGVEIDLIFEIEGEPGFRRREARLIEELADLHDIVLATGGGAVLDPANRALLKKSGLIVYLSAPAVVLARRTARDRRRPLLRGGDRLQRIEQLLSERESFYREIADVIIDTAGHSVKESLDEICRRLDLPCAK
jgi:shikimate kinase